MNTQNEPEKTALNERDALRRRIRKLRRQYLERQETLAEWSAQIVHHVLSMDVCRRARRIMCYYSLPGEVQTLGLIRTLIAQGKEVYLPVTKPNKEMDAVRLRDADAVHAGAFRVMEPVGDEKIDPSELELILIPGLAFDRMGGRMGYGAGCYDRFLPDCRCVLAALAFEFQMTERVPVEAHDVPMHLVVTEQGVYCRSDEENFGKE